MVELEKDWSLPPFSTKKWRKRDNWQADVEQELGSKLQIKDMEWSPVTVWIAGFHHFAYTAIVVFGTSMVWPDLYSKPQPEYVIEHSPTQAASPTINAASPSPSPSITSATTPRPRATP